MWPPHLAEDVRFDHAAASQAVVTLRRLARAVEDHATHRAQQLAAADHFRGPGRATVDDLTTIQARRAAGLVQRLHAEARTIEDDALAASRAADRLADARARWRVEQELRAERERRTSQERTPW